MEPAVAFGVTAFEALEARRREPPARLAAHAQVPHAPEGAQKIQASVAVPIVE